MPLTNKGKAILRKFQKQYGSIRGKSIFYAWENKVKLPIIKKRRF